MRVDDYCSLDLYLWNSKAGATVAATPAPTQAKPVVSALPPPAGTPLPTPKGAADVKAGLFSAIGQVDK